MPPLPIALVALLALCAPTCGWGWEWQEPPPDLPHNYGVLGMEVEAQVADTLRVIRVRLHSPAAIAGLRPGDLVLGAVPYRLRTLEAFSDYIKSRVPGTRVTLAVLREAEALQLECEVTDRRHLYWLMGEQGRVPSASLPRLLAWDEAADSLERVARALVRREGAAGALDSLVDAFRLETTRFASDCRLADIHYLLHHPLKASTVASGVAGNLSSAADLEGLLAAAATHLDLEAAAYRGGAGPALGQAMPPELERLVLEPLVLAGRLVEQAMAGLDSVEQAYLLSHAEPLLERFGRSFYLDRGDSAETEAHVRALRLAKKVDVASLVAAARALAPLASPAARRRLRQVAGDLRRAPLPAGLPDAFTGEFVFAAHTEWGWVLVGDRGDNFYGEDALFILDLGGDDVYAGNAGAPSLIASGSASGEDGGLVPTPTLQRAAPVGVVLDLGGDDRYIGNRPGSIGGGLGGVGLLVDARGNDLYQGGRLTQGAAFCGVGILIDEEGDDTYLARESAQAAAYFGLGILWDQEGRDIYSATQYAKGFGGTRGLGLLLDRRGDDRYLADRAVPSGYGTAGVYNGWSQGAGCGFRGYCSGGVGVLVDEAGDDEYQAGNFSQGVGYFFGLGILVDGGGRDAYRGTRYTQGASAHQAAGVLIDAGGDDRYRGRVAANQGGAWDVGVAVLEDRGGDDEYLADDLAQGAAAMNGLAILLDWAGADRYEARSGQAHGGSTLYWGGRNALNLGALIDAGSGADTYTIRERADGATFRSSSIGLFSDH